MNLLNKQIYHKYFKFLKAALFQILFLLMSSSESYAWVGHENSFTFWEAIYIFGIMFSSCIAVFFIFKFFFHLYIYITRDKLKIGAVYIIIIPILVLLYVYIFVKTFGDIKIFTDVVFILMLGMVTVTFIMAFIIALYKYLRRKLRITSFVSKQKKVNSKVIMWVLDLFLFFASSVIVGSILYLLLVIWIYFS